MIDIHNEQLVTLKAASKLLPNRPHMATLYRWAEGVEVKPKRGDNRQAVRVQLETVVIANDRYTSKEALQQFVEAYTRARDGVAGDEMVRGQQKRQRDVKAARQRLAKAGI